MIIVHRDEYGKVYHRSLLHTHLRELFLSKLSELGFDPKQFGLHSLRSDGASAEANAGVPDRLFK